MLDQGRPATQGIAPFMNANLKPLPVSEKYYGERAKNYDEKRHGAEIYHKDQAVINNLLRGIVRSGDEVLDVACGTNRISDFIRELGGKYHGIDISSDMVELAKSKDPDSDIRVADARDIPHPDAKFDLVMSVKFLKWLPDQKTLEQVVTELARVLKPGGTALLHQKILAGSTLMSSPLVVVHSCVEWVVETAQSIKNGKKKVKTRAVEESEFLARCEEAGLRLRFTTMPTNITFVGDNKRVNAFYIFEKADSE